MTALTAEPAITPEPKPELPAYFDHYDMLIAFDHGRATGVCRDTAFAMADEDRRRAESAHTGERKC